MADKMLDVEGLSKRYGKFWALRELSFSIAEGEVVGFLGQNGAGKSTAIKIFSNLVRPTAGDARMYGESILGTGKAAHRRKLGAIVEAPRFYPQLSGRRNLALLARIHGIPHERTEALLREVGLMERADERFGRYSMGMKQRVGLAAVFLHRPSLVILDEPTSGLDPVGTHQIHDVIRHLVAQHGVTVLLSSHQMDEVAALCDRALVLDQGRLVLEQGLGSPGNIEVIRSEFGRLASAVDPV